MTREEFEQALAEFPKAAFLEWFSSSYANALYYNDAEKVLVQLKNAHWAADFEKMCSRIKDLEAEAKTLPRLSDRYSEIMDEIHKLHVKNNKLWERYFGGRR